MHGHSRGLLLGHRPVKGLIDGGATARPCAADAPLAEHSRAFASGFRYAADGESPRRAELECLGRGADDPEFWHGYAWGCLHAALWPTRAWAP